MESFITQGRANFNHIANAPLEFTVIVAAAIICTAIIICTPLTIKRYISSSQTADLEKKGFPGGWHTPKDINKLTQEEIIQEMHLTASKCDDKMYADYCKQLVEHCPQAVNEPIPPYGFTPFLRACWSGNADVVTFMLQRGADFAKRTTDGDSAFYLAVHGAAEFTQSWDPSCVNVLYNTGCDINIQNYHGFTPLHLAARKGHFDLVRWLLLHGADPYKETKCGLRPVDMAKEEGHHLAYSFLSINVGNSSSKKSQATPIPPNGTSIPKLAKTH